MTEHPLEPMWKDMADAETTARRFVRVVDGRIVRVMSDDEAPSIIPLTSPPNNPTEN